MGHDLESVTLWTRYEWTCPACDEDNEEPLGASTDVVECQRCGAHFRGDER